VLFRSIGFLGIWAWFRWRADRLALSARDVMDLSILAAAGCLIGGRIFDILVYEADYYRLHPLHALDWWRGGLATHGVMLGGVAGVALFAWSRHRPLAVLLDEICVPAAVLMGIGRFGNFIEGGVVGSPTTLPWGVLYPDLALPRHPVALYDGIKNLAMAVLLARALKRWPAGSGVVSGLYLVLYAGLRFLIDFLRDYESFWGAMGRGQYFNLAMLALGVVVLAIAWPRRFAPLKADPPPPAPKRAAGVVRTLVFAALCLYPLGIPTSWTRVNIEQIRESQPIPAAPATP
jgi:phosphatidylglycerol:prolipoprotein diacylglycerol transferase